MDKLNEMLIGTLAVMGAFITKRVFNNHDTFKEAVLVLFRELFCRINGWLQPCVPPVCGGVDTVKYAGILNLLVDV